MESNIIILRGSNMKNKKLIDELIIKDICLSLTSTLLF